MSDQSTRLDIDELARQLAQAVPKNLRALGEDLERNFKALLQSGISRMDLVTRQEFDLQAALLERAREKLEKIDARLADLERGIGTNRH